ncbi:MAG: response regulator, partial [Acidobacteriota bacterium]
MSTPQEMILIVDDEPSIRKVVSRWLEKEGYRWRTAANVEEARKRLEEESFSLILLDLMMPGQSGEVLLHSVIEQYPDTAVVMATAIDDRGTAMELLRSGAFAYIIKPLDQIDVVINIASALERRKARILARDHQKL